MFILLIFLFVYVNTEYIFNYKNCQYIILDRNETDSNSWYEATAKCHERNSTLIYFTSIDECKNIYNFIQNKNLSVFFINTRLYKGRYELLNGDILDKCIHKNSLDYFESEHHSCFKVINNIYPFVL